MDHITLYDRKTVSLEPAPLIPVSRTVISGSDVVILRVRCSPVWFDVVVSRTPQVLVLTFGPRVASKVFMLLLLRVQAFCVRLFENFLVNMLMFCIQLALVDNETERRNQTCRPVRRVHSP